MLKRAYSREACKARGIARAAWKRLPLAEKLRIANKERMKKVEGNNNGLLDAKEFFGECDEDCDIGVIRPIEIPKEGPEDDDLPSPEEFFKDIEEEIENDNEC